MGDKTSTITTTNGTSVSDENDVTGGQSIGAGTVGYTGTSSANANVSGSSITGSNNNTSTVINQTTIQPTSDSSALDADLLLAAGKNMDDSQGGNGDSPSSTDSGGTSTDITPILLIGAIILAGVFFL